MMCGCQTLNFEFHYSYDKYDETKQHDVTVTRTENVPVNIHYLEVTLPG